MYTPVIPTCKKCGTKITHAKNARVCEKCRVTDSPYVRKTITKRNIGLNEGKNYKQYLEIAKELDPKNYGHYEYNINTRGSQLKTPKIYKNEKIKKEKIPFYFDKRAI